MAKFIKDKRELIQEDVVKDSSINNDNDQLIFGRSNYMMILAAILLMIIGFILMAGGGNPDPNIFDAKAVYHPRRITLAPILVIGGIIVGIIAIVKKP